MVVRVLFERQFGLLIRKSDMNPTVFTIESVHGVKQTFVLAPPTKTVSGEAAKQQSASPAEKSAADEQSPSHSPR